MKLLYYEKFSAVSIYNCAVTETHWCTAVFSRWYGKVMEMDRWTKNLFFLLSWLDCLCYFGFVAPSTHIPAIASEYKKPIKTCPVNMNIDGVNWDITVTVQMITTSCNTMRQNTRSVCACLESVQRSAVLIWSVSSPVRHQWRIHHPSGTASVEACSTKTHRNTWSLHHHH